MPDTIKNEKYPEALVVLLISHVKKIGTIFGQQIAGPYKNGISSEGLGKRKDPEIV